MIDKLNTKSLSYILICNMIGSGIFFVEPMILQITKAIIPSLLCWIIAGLISLLLGLCYSELGSRFPEEGGDLIYLSKAYNIYLSHFFSLISLIIILPCGCSIMCKTILEYVSGDDIFNTIVIILLLCLINILGSKFTFRVQYVLTVLKVILFAIFVSFAIYSFLFIPRSKSSALFDPKGKLSNSSNLYDLMLGLFLCLWPYDGWNSGNFMGHRIANPRKTLPYSITFSILFVMMIYLLTNISLLYVLPYDTFLENSPNNKGIMVAYLKEFNIPENITNILTRLLVIIPSFGTLNGSTMVGVNILMGVMGKLKIKGKHSIQRIISIILFCFLTLIFTFVKERIKLIKNISFFTFIFYGLSVSSIFILRKKYNSDVKPYKTNIFVLLISIFLCFSLFSFAIFNTFSK
ncbi:b(0,+)-type amino acid transporter 1 [Astathelohania contejeani]|uniref:B(0,+)-type amino acid transporter 1 n=1 Tax=Astathelohania contejeani TaxID=164912 RepID=A0ABQ7HVT2_9MICR|nr:b(0,+)-type amino acid transporter 1 [Thelohania contejeani]